MRRREPRIRAIIGFGLGALLLVSPVTAQTSSPPSPAPDLPATRAGVLVEPPVMRDLSPAPKTVEVNLVASPTQLSLLPGQKTDVWAYNGSIPGPTLEVWEGDRVIVNFRNELPEETTIHWHGLHLPVEMDGSPFNPVAPGEGFRYVFTIPDGTAGTYLYHPHPNHRTAWQMGMGLYGAIIVRDPDDPLPSDLSEKLLILSDNRFRPDGSLDWPEPGSKQARLDEENGREGDVLLVNGQVMPVLEIRPGEVQRWRVVNASGARVYRLALPGHDLLHVGSDGGLFEHPVERQEMVVANTERVELLVRGTGGPGTSTSFQTLPYDRYMPRWRPEDWDQTRDLLTLRYTEEPRRDFVALPETLRVVPPMDTATATATRVMRLSQGRINGDLMDMERVDVNAPLGATEIWEIRNIVGMDHPFHLHGFRFQVISRNGEPVPQRWWKDTVNVPKRETVRFIVRYDDFPGKWMFHCHILEHEDQGMMGILEVQSTSAEETP